MRTKTIIVLIGVLAFTTTALAGSSSNCVLLKWTIGPNTQSATSPRYTLAEVIGQPVIGHAASATYGACYGYRCGLSVIPPAIVPGHRAIYLPILVREYDPNVDRYEPDNSAPHAGSIATEGSMQQHNFYPTGDVDWVRLDVGPGTYVIATNISNNLYPDTIMALYAANAITEVAHNDDCTGFTRASCLTYTSSISTTLYLKLWPYDATSIGADSWYGLAVVKQ
jgi:hypothetical protein